MLNCSGQLALALTAETGSKDSHHASSHASKPKSAPKEEDSGAQESDDSTTDNIEGGVSPSEIQESIKQGIVRANLLKVLIISTTKFYARKPMILPPQRPRRRNPLVLPKRMTPRPTRIPMTTLKSKRFPREI
jgi:hypothetical protein